MTGSLWVLAVLLSHWRRRPFQLAALLAGLMVATALWSGVQAINVEARASYDRAARLVGQDSLDRLTPAAGATIARDVYVRLRRAGWSVSPVLEGRIETADGVRLRALGVDPLTLPASALSDRLAEGGVPLPDFIAPTGRLLAAPETLERLGAAPGDRPVTEAGLRLPPLVAAEGLLPGLILGDIGAVARLTEQARRVSYLLIDPDAPRPATDWRRVAGEALVLDPAGGESELARLTDSFHLNLTAFGVLSFTVGLFIVHAAVGLAFEQRLATIRTLRACGATARQVTGLMLGEILAFAVIGGLAGVAAGHLLAGALLPDVAATLSGLYGAPVPGEIALRGEVWLAGLGISLAGTLVAAGHTLARAWSMPVLASARRQAWRAATARALRTQALAAVALLAAAGLVWWLGEGLAAGFAVMAGVLVGAALLLPGLLALGLRLAGRAARGPVAEWAVADSRQQLPGLSLALMALLLALAANIGVGTMVESFRDTFTGWLDRRLAAEVYFDPRDAAEARAIADWAERRPEITAVLAQLRAETEIAGWPVEVVGHIDHETYRAAWPLIAEAAASLGPGRGGRGRNDQRATRPARRAGHGWRSDARHPGRSLAGDDRRHLSRLRQSEGADRRHPRRGARALARGPARRARVARGRGRERGRHRRDAGPLRPRPHRHRRSGGGQGAVAAHFRADLRGDGHAERAHARGRGNRALRQPRDAGRSAPARARAALGDGADAGAAGAARACQDAGARADDGGAGGAARPRGGLASGRGRQCRGVWLAPADAPLSGAVGAARGADRAGRAARRRAAGAASGPAFARPSGEALRGGTLMRALLVLLLLALPLPALAQGLAGMASGGEGFAEVRPDTPITFPEDHGAHPRFRIEWWYVTANLEDAEGTPLGAQFTLFRFATRPEPEGEGWANGQVWMGHAALTTADTHRHAERLARGGIGQAGVETGPFRAWIDDWRFASTDAGFSPLALSARGAGFAYDLTLTAEGPMVLQGEAGHSVKSEAGQASHYASQPFFRVAGSVTLDGAPREVTGRAWMDREWSSQPLAEDQPGWDWMSLHLSGGAKLMVYRLRSRDGDHYLTGNWITPEGESTRLAPGKIAMTPLGEAEVAGRRVPVRWRVEIPGRGVAIETRPLNPAAWNATSTEYWEGPVFVSGSHGGEGYLEMTGY